MVLLIADSAVQEQALRADVLVTEWAEAAGFDGMARAWQYRPHFHRATARAFEHVPRAPSTRSRSGRGTPRHRRRDYCSTSMMTAWSVRLRATLLTSERVLVGVVPLVTS